MRIITFNINGIRASVKNGLLDFILSDKADVFCFQETKAQIEQIPKEIENLPGYRKYYNSAERKDTVV